MDGRVRKFDWQVKRAWPDELPQDAGGSDYLDTYEPTAPEAVSKIIRSKVNGAATVSRTSSYNFNPPLTVEASYEIVYEYDEGGAEPNSVYIDNIKIKQIVQKGIRHGVKKHQYREIVEAIEHAFTKQLHDIQE